MNNTELQKDQMETLQRLAQVNIEISNGKAILQDLKDDLESFMVSREALEKSVIDRVYEENKELLKEISKDHSKIAAYYNEIKSYTVFLKELQENISNELSLFKQDSEKFIAYVKEEENRLCELRKDIELDKQIINQQDEFIKKANTQLIKDRSHLESQQVTLANSYKELKKLWKK